MMQDDTMVHNESDDAAALEAARHLCQEARVVLTSLRAGPPHVARGELAQDLQDIRGWIKHNMMILSRASSGRGSSSSSLPENHNHTQTEAPPVPSGAANNQPQPQQSSPELEVGVVARPFLSIVMDPRASGPHTLVTLRALHRLLARGSLQIRGTNTSTEGTTTHDDKQGFMTVALEAMTKGVLNCKFEQTDAGADEAVEMAIADLLALLVQLDRRSMHVDTLMDAFNTVFVTRNTFVHSPALCYHFEDVLTTMISAVFGDLDHLQDTGGKLLLEFLVNQLLHTPLVVGGRDDEASREAQLAHDATRVLCLRLTRTAIRTGLQEVPPELWAQAAQLSSDEGSLLQIIQDDLCLALLMTGQAIWATSNDNGAGGSSSTPGFISLEVLSEICSTLSTLWTTVHMRKHLVPQFEAIFTGFYQRALVLLRKRINPSDTMSFHGNLVFDAGVEIILESLVDIMCLHDHRQTVAQGNGGSLETLFATYDCHIKKSDVAVGLMVELCRCAGSKVDEEGDILETSLHEDISGNSTRSASDVPEIATEPSSEEHETEGSGELVGGTEGFRMVPPHLKELCAEAIIGGMKCMFRDDHPTEQTRQERKSRRSILAGHVSPAPQSLSDLDRARSAHHLRNIKSKKRLMRRAAQLFNKKASKGIEFLVESGVIDSNPVTPRSVASFLRNGIVVGLDKRAVGAYLGEAGKGAVAGKSPPDWQRDWFHKECLTTYCNLFRFERQSLLDGLRMFLAAFRLPGEAQQIDRILQAFSESCGRVCEESRVQSLFSDDPKRAGDAAYLLSFSIIMLNTDLHNDNIREDRKMSKPDFFKNNSDYGRDITDPGKELPPEYLGSIYDSIKEEEIRTEGEGADGSMTVERWKDVLRGSSELDVDELPSIHDAEDLTELVLEHVWMPIMSAISALWGVKKFLEMPNAVPVDTGSSGMLGAQGARLGMNLAWDMLVGVRQLGRNDIFCKIFNLVCKYTGLLDCVSNAAERSWSFSQSVESQGAFVVALRVAKDAHDEIGVEGWKRIWLMLFELRDLKMLGGGSSTKGRSILMETEADLLKEVGRREFAMMLAKRGLLDDGDKKSGAVTGMFGAMGRALFGSVEEPDMSEQSDTVHVVVPQTAHGKEEQLLWDELASSDDEDESGESPDDFSGSLLSLGAQFEAQLIQEDLLLNRAKDFPVTGLERVDESAGSRISPRARVRKRLSKGCDYAGLVSDSRFMDDKGICNVLESLIALVPTDSLPDEDGTEDDASRLSGEFSTRIEQYPTSPASQAFVEVLICEIVLRNRDRLGMLWDSHLRDHYTTRLRYITQTCVEQEQHLMSKISGSVEKCVTGLLRICICAVQRGEIANRILGVWKLLDDPSHDSDKLCLLSCLDKHVGEGIWRICRGLDDATHLDDDGWTGVLALLNWCSIRGAQLPPVRPNVESQSVGLSDDDPALQAYRAIHYLLNVSDVKNSVPYSIIQTIQEVVLAGDGRNCPKLSVAALDLLQVLGTLVEEAAAAWHQELDYDARQHFWKTNWSPILEIMAEAVSVCHLPSVRQHSLSILTDSFLDKRGGIVPLSHLCEALKVICIPLGAKRIMDLRFSKDTDAADALDESTIEVELCIGLLFKPLRHHVQSLVDEDQPVLLSLWTQILHALKEVFSQVANSEEGRLPSKVLIKTSNELIVEHLRNVIMVLSSYGVLHDEPQQHDDLSDITWKAVAEMDYCKKFLKELKQAATSSE